MKLKWLILCENKLHVSFPQIIRIQNEDLYVQYQSQKKKVEREVQGNMLVEQQLWHGTDKETVFKICKTEFNRSYAGKNGKNKKGFTLGVEAIYNSLNIHLVKRIDNT